ncbi:MAG: DUF1573 domain-containing protein [Candidatus Omnitrophota bacterium]
MKKMFLGLLACALFISAAYCAEEKIDANTWGFGRVREGQIVKHAFRLQNESDKTLTIKDAHTSCGCTASEIKKKVLGPGESTKIEVSFNSKGYVGEVKQFIYVNTDAIDNQVIRFIIKAEVVKSSQAGFAPAVEIQEE